MSLISRKDSLVLSYRIQVTREDIRIKLVDIILMLIVRNIGKKLPNICIN